MIKTCPAKLVRSDQLHANLFSATLYVAAKGLLVYKSYYLFVALTRSAAQQDQM